MTFHNLLQEGSVVQVITHVDNEHAYRSLEFELGSTINVTLEKLESCDTILQVGSEAASSWVDPLHFADPWLLLSKTGGPPRS